MTETLTLIVNEAARLAGLNPSDLNEKTVLLDLSLDSLDTLEFLMALEDKLGLEIDPSELGNCTHIGDLAALLDARLDA